MLINKNFAFTLLEIQQHSR